jgi:hypothetical protein
MLALTCGMRPRSSSCSAAVLVATLGCRPEPPSVPVDERVDDPASTAPAVDPGGPRSAGEFGPPPRWAIDGSTIAEDASLPLELDRALREHGRTRDEVQDHIVVDLNDDARLDAVVSLPAPAVAGAYDFLVLLSSGEAVRVHSLGPLVDEAIFSVAVVPLVDGPTLIAAAPRLGSCERGPAWTFLRPTGDLLEAVGRIAVEPYDCSVAKAEIAFVRDDDGMVSAVEQRHGEVVTRYQWDAALGSFAPASE